MHRSLAAALPLLALSLACGGGDGPGDAPVPGDADAVLDLPDAPAADDVAGDPGDPDAWPRACKGFDQPSAPTCTGASALGCCDTDGRVVWCQDGALYCYDCRDNPAGNDTCGWRVVEGFAGYDCGGAGADPSGVNPLACGGACNPSCAGRDCGDDGCGGSCGSCADGQECRGGTCADPGAEYPAVCNGFQEPSGLTCPATVTSVGCCDATGRVVWCDRGRLYCNDCSRNPAPQNSCGWLDMQAFQGYDCGGAGADPAGQVPRECGATCQPSCSGKQCGDDGCGGSCGACAGDLLCRAGACVTAPGGVLAGRLQYEVRDPAFDASGDVSLGATRVVAAGGVPVTVADASGAEVGRATVRGDGTVRVPLSRALAAGDRLVVATGYAPSGSLVLGVLKVDQGGEPGFRQGPLWAWTAPAESLDLGTVTITEAQGSGALHIFRLALDGMGQVLEHFASGTVGLPTLALLWSPGASWSIGLGYGKVTVRVTDGPYLANAIFIGGDAGASGPWGGAGVLHEFGHYVQNNFSRDDSPGGSHFLGSRIAPPFAWAEAFSNWFGVATVSRVSGGRDPVLWVIASQGGGSQYAFWIDFAKGESTAGDFLLPEPQGGLRQDLDECHVTRMIWDLWDGADVPEAPGEDDGSAFGTAAVMEAVASPRFLAGDRGATGVDFVDFVDALLCARPDRSAGVQKTVKDIGLFPYDGTPSCP